MKTKTTKLLKIKVSRTEQKKNLHN